MIAPGFRIRQLEPGDGHALRYGFDHLSEQSRYQRFHGFASQLSERHWCG